MKIVRDTACELPERLEFLRLRAPGLRLLQRDLGAALLRHVARDLGKANQAALFIANGIDHDIRPKQGAILANAPIFRFETAGGLGSLQRTGRQPGGPIRLGVES